MDSTNLDTISFRKLLMQTYHAFLQFRILLHQMTKHERAKLELPFLSVKSVLFCIVQIQIVPPLSKQTIFENNKNKFLLIRKPVPEKPFYHLSSSFV